MLALLPRVNGMLRECCTEFGDEVTLQDTSTTKDVLCMKIPDWPEIGMYCTWTKGKVEAESLPGRGPIRKLMVLTCYEWLGKAW